MQKAPWSFGLALFFFVGSLITLFIWIPNDIETGVIETFRRQVTIGDSFAPTVMAAGMLVVSFVMGVMVYLQPGSEVKQGLDKQSLSFFLRLFMVIAPSLALMIYTGPLVVDLINLMGGDLGSYRLQKATVPYKYLGYLSGGFVMVFGIICVLEGRFSYSAAWLSIATVIFLTVLYDVPFDSLLLPPNGSG